MDIDFLRESLKKDNPPTGLSVYVQAMWYDAKGNWNKAHELVQSIEDKKASWIHAYLHRKEGDVYNADYWYAKAAKKRSSLSLDEEWKEIVLALL